MSVAALIRCASSQSRSLTGQAATCSTPGWRTPAPGRSPRRGSRRRQGHGPAGRSFWEDVTGEVGGRSPQDLVLLLDLLEPATQLMHLVLVTGRGRSLTAAGGSRVL